MNLCKGEKPHQVGVNYGVGRGGGGGLNLLKTNAPRMVKPSANVSTIG
jgi:hypothetical protein